MRLQQILDDLVHGAPGATAAILADWEGEAVVISAANGVSDYDIKVIGAHYGVLLNLVRDLNQRMGLGDAGELTYLQEQFHVVVTTINNEYYLVLTFKPESLPARARPAVKKAIRELAPEIL